MNFAFLTTALALLSHACLAAASPTTDLASAVRAPNTTRFRWAGPATTFVYDNSGKQIAAIRPGDNVTSLDLAPAVDPGLLTKAFETTAKITEVVCTNAGPTACVATAIIGLFGIFFALYQASGRDLVHAHMLVTDFPPIRGCGTICRLRNEAPEGDWRLIGNATIDGTFHAVHYSRIDSISGLRAIQYPGGAPVSKRAEERDGGVVADYLWDDNNVQAYDSFHSFPSEVSSFGDDATDTLIEENSILECAMFTDSDGVLAPGLIAVGWNNQPFEFQDGESGALLSECAEI